MLPNGLGWMMGRRSSNKGKFGECEVVALARKHGLKAERTWQTAQARDPSPGAAMSQSLADRYRLRVLADGFRALYEALDGVGRLITGAT